MSGFLASIGFEKTACAGIIALANTIDKYKDKPDEIRFCLLVDKVKLILDLASAFGINVGYFLGSSLVEKELLEKTGSALKDIREEFEQLEMYIIGRRQLEHKEIIRKLDDVLLGPDYQEGKEMMEAAKSDFVEGERKRDSLRTPKYTE